MLAVLVLILRSGWMISLYAFLGWMIYTLWRELRFQSQSVATQKVPQLILGLDNEPDSTIKKYTAAESSLAATGNVIIKLKMRSSHPGMPAWCTGIINGGSKICNQQTEPI